MLEINDLVLEINELIIYTIYIFNLEVSLNEKYYLVLEINDWVLEINELIIYTIDIFRRIIKWIEN